MAFKKGHTAHRKNRKKNLLKNIENFREAEDAKKYKDSDDITAEDVQPITNGSTGVVDIEAHKEYTNLIEALRNHPDHQYQTSDPDLMLNLLGQNTLIKNKITHLPDAEQEEIKKIMTEINRMKGKLIGLKLKAYGLKRGGGGAILDVKAAELIEYFGRFYSDGEVHKIVTQKWGYDLGMNAVGDFRQRHAEEIRERRETYSREYSDIRLGYKRSRLEEYTYLYRTRKNTYRLNNYPREDAKVMVSILEQIRKECEGEQHHLTVDGEFNVNMSAKMEMHIHQQLMNDVSIKSLIVARVAARLRVNPLILMERLTTSFYAKYTGFAEPDRELANNEKIYPSSLIYDFDRLEAKSNAIRVQQPSNTVEATVEIIEANKDELNKIKEAMVRRIIARKMHVNVSDYEEKRIPFDKENENVK